jgi:antitoxin component of MazEF toxin-antitoxin module
VRGSLALYGRMRLGTDGCIAVPPEYQKELGWKPGDEVELSVEAGALIVRNNRKDPSVGAELISKMRGKGRLKGRTDDFMRILRPAE